MTARLTPEDRRLRAISEATWQADVLALAALRGWTAHHSPRAGIRANGSVRRTPNTKPGWPDLFLVRGERTLAVELKRETGAVTAEQSEWLVALSNAGVPTHIWRPRDLDAALRVLA